jgi:hypothetical protein
VRPFDKLRANGCFPFGLSLSKPCPQLTETG